MAKIKTQQFSAKGLSGEVLTFGSAISVDSHGLFSATIPEELAQSAKQLANTSDWKTEVRVSKAVANHRVEGSRLDRIESFIRDAMKNHLVVDEKRELVILYRHRNMTTFSRAADGGIHPNGHFAGKDAEWAGNPSIHATSLPDIFSIGVNACVREKITYTRPSGSKIVYERPPGDHFARDAIQRLNGFCVASLDGHATGVCQMTYSTKAADFFTDMMLALCRLGEQFDQFVGDKDQLAIAIERGTSMIDYNKDSA